MLLPAKEFELFVNASQVAWVTVNRKGDAVRVVYAGGQDLDLHHYVPDAAIRDLLDQFKRDPRFVPINGGAEYVNLSLVLRAELHLPERIAFLYFLGLARLEIGPDDFDAIRGRLAETKA